MEIGQTLRSPPGPLARKPSSFLFENSANHVSYAALSANPGYVGGGVYFKVEDSVDIVVIDRVPGRSLTAI